MELTQWLSLFSICLLGAMSPGPSLAVVTRATLSGGRGAGVACALGHGLGVGLYGLLTVTGLALLVTRSSLLFQGIQLAGAAYLLYLGAGALRASPGTPVARPHSTTGIGQGAAREGFLIAFLNPKLAVFMLALFSQFLRPDAELVEKSIMVLTVGLTDGLWYALIAAALSHPSMLNRLQRNAVVIDRIFGLILVLLALTVGSRALGLWPAT